MTRRETINAINRALRFLFDGMKPCGMDIKQGRHGYYRVEDMTQFKYYDFRHWQVAIDVNWILSINGRSMMSAANKPVHCRAYVKVKRLYWDNKGSAVASRTAKMVEMGCADEDDYKKLVTVFEVLKNESLAPTLAGIDGAEPMMEELLK